MIRFTFWVVCFLLLESCSEETDNKDAVHDSKSIISFDSVPDHDSLYSKILSNVSPLFADIDTIVLDDNYPIYCGNVTDEKIAQDFFPIAINPSKFSILSKTLHKTILFKSKIYGFDPNNSTKTQLSLDGIILSNNKIRILESYIRGFSYCSIEKIFVYVNAKWECETKEKQCSTPFAQFKNGGFNGLREFLEKNLRYPNDSIEGRIVVKFKVDTIGKTKEIKIVRGISEEADKEVIRVVKLLEFFPASNNGKKVDSDMTLPVVFKSK